MSLHVAVAATSSASADECDVPVWLFDVEDITTLLSFVVYPLVDLRVDTSRAQSLSVKPSYFISVFWSGCMVIESVRLWYVYLKMCHRRS